jgi:Fur family peroxide stress response transcriptional regulator
MKAAELSEFRDLCSRSGLAATHQRLAVWQALRSMHGHPSPEEVYGRVKPRVPGISLATVYKNIHLLIEAGAFREVSLHHGSMRVETNQEPHHHLVCRKCRSITDIDSAHLGIAGERRKLPGGFLAERFSVDVLGLCGACQKQK